MARLRHPVDAQAERNEKQYQEHGTSIRELIGPEGMRVIGRAYDLGIIKETNEQEATHGGNAKSRNSAS